MPQFAPLTTEKGPLRRAFFASAPLTCTPPWPDPEQQFLLLIDHIRRIREHVEWRDSGIMVFVESNLGYESEHHERALRGLPMVRFHFDEKRRRVGVTTTLPVKHAAVTLTRSLLMEERIALVRTVMHARGPARRAAD